MVNVTDHKFVPDHELLDDPEEIDEVLAEYNVSKTDLPKIKRTDPALPDDAEPGDVIRIVRESRTTDRAIVYRLVIS
ncbi:DNA-directed RNA polymerase subunit H [Halopenitus sp. H-Gu1]|uniref:DNA-directed RNA polymerase subunit H n=1 Tax=Halopenitus sp. H-Gu1 TaxID=3242697 RepID=UPI00359E63FD